MNSALPIPVRELAARLGGIWTGAEHPFEKESHPGHISTLFDVQDEILDPRTYPTVEGRRVFVTENQGVWAFGYQPSSPNDLHAAGEFWGGPDGEWRAVTEFGIADALCLTLVSNLFWLSHQDADYGRKTTSRPPQLNVCLWSHPEFEDFGGFWTDAESSALFYSGLDLVIPRRPWPSG